MSPTINEATSLIKAKALELGFSDVGFSAATELVEDKIRLSAWLENGYQAEMGYLDNHFDKRTDASKLVDGAKSVISLLVNYFPKEKQNPEAPIVAKYVYGNDYHEVFKPILNELLQYIQLEISPLAEGRCFTDSAPILERAYAVQGGLGWIGKNSNLIHKRLGSFFLIAEVIVNIPLHYDSPIMDACGGCTRCIDACPTNAITDDRTINSNRCISYLTIENKGEIALEFENQLNNRVFGCDICQDVCPWNWKARPHNFDGLKANSKILEMTAVDWVILNQETFSATFKGSPIKRAKFSGIERTLRFIGAG